MPLCPYVLPYFMRPVCLHATEQLEGRTLLFVTASSVSACLMFVFMAFHLVHRQAQLKALPGLWGSRAQRTTIFTSTNHAHLPAHVSGSPCEHKEPLFLSSRCGGRFIPGTQSLFSSCFVQETSRKSHLRSHQDSNNSCLTGTLWGLF